jgi:hypothetical protein
VTHGPGNNQVVHPLFPQRLQELRFSEAVGEILLKNFLAGQRLYGGVDLSSLCVGKEESGARSDRDMLDMVNGEIVFSGVVEETPGLLSGLQNACELHLTPREVVVLQIDEQQSCFHKGLLRPAFLFLHLLEFP